jgi:hypothetical protein
MQGSMVENRLEYDALGNIKEWAGCLFDDMGES